MVGGGEDIKTERKKRKKKLGSCEGFSGKQSIEYVLVVKAVVPILLSRGRYWSVSRNFENNGLEVSLSCSSASLAMSI